MKRYLMRPLELMAWGLTSLIGAMFLAGLGLWLGQTILDGAIAHRSSELEFAKYGQPAVGQVVDLKERRGSRGYRIVFPIIKVSSPDGRSVTYEERYIGIDSVWSVSELLPKWRGRQVDLLCIWAEGRCMASNGNMKYGYDKPFNFYLGVSISLILIISGLVFVWLTVRNFPRELRVSQKNNEIDAQ